MANLNNKIKNLGNNLFALKNNLVLIFYLGLLVLVFFEFFAVQDSVNLIFASKKEQPPSRSVQKVRLNFADFEANKKRLETGQDFVPNISADQNPFKVKQ